MAERFQRISEATTQQPSGFVQGLISELVLGGGSSQQQAISQKNLQARSAFARLLSPAEKATFTGWDMAGWVRWLEGLQGTYERRMVRMCRILDANSSLVTTKSSSSSSYIKVTTTPLFTYSWPRGGMFIWLRVLFSSHPLFNFACPPGSRFPVITGPLLSTALMIFLTQKPFLVLAATGSMFSATEEIREREGWEYFRLCFAAEKEENVDKAAERFAAGVRAFWEVRDARVVERLLGEVMGMGEGEGVEGLMMGMGVGEDVTRLGWGMGC